MNFGFVTVARNPDSKYVQSDDQIFKVVAFLDENKSPIFYKYSYYSISVWLQVWIKMFHRKLSNWLYYNVFKCLRKILLLGFLCFFQSSAYSFLEYWFMVYEFTSLWPLIHSGRKGLPNFIIVVSTYNRKLGKEQYLFFLSLHC